MDKKRILVTGGTGYIGSHTTVELINAGYSVVIIDNLSNSNIGVLDGIEAITGVRPDFVQGDCQDIATLRKLFADYPDVAIEAVATSGLEGLRLIGEKHPELMFLDIELPDISGIDFLERMDNYTHSHCRVVMYSAYDRFMLPAFRNSAFDFLVKPFGKEELRTVMNRVYAGRKYGTSAAPTWVTAS